MKTAILVEEDFREKQASIAGPMGPACSYKLSEPLDGNELVWVSQANAAYTGWVTSIFPAREVHGEYFVEAWDELRGSVKGRYVTPDELMTELGYKVMRPGGIV